MVASRLWCGKISIRRSRTTVQLGHFIKPTSDDDSRGKGIDRRYPFGTVKHFRRIFHCCRLEDTSFSFDRRDLYVFSIRTKQITFCKPQKSSKKLAKMWVFPDVSRVLHRSASRVRVMTERKSPEKLAKFLQLSTSLRTFTFLACSSFHWR